jgi:hypothetical protein
MPEPKVRRRLAQARVAGGIIQRGWLRCLRFEARFACQPMFSLVYPSVYPSKADGSEIEQWRDL